MNAQKHLLFRFVAIILIIACISPVSAIAAEPRASDYLIGYGAYIYPAGWGKVQVWFSVDGTEYMDEIGALEVRLFESTDQEAWTWIKTFEHQDYSDMLVYNDYHHTSHVEYSGTIGRYYKAYVCIWAGKNGDGDTRYFWTNTEKATLFAG